jgi:hypothetical protein
VASGDAVQGPWRMNESDFRYVDDPSVAITDRGVIGVVWVDQARKDVLVQIHEPDGRTRLRQPVNVSRNARTFSWLPRLALGSADAGEVYVLWQEIIFSGGSHGGEILFARSTDGGRTFTEPINLSNSIAGDGKGRLTPHHWDNGSLDLAAGPRGGLYAAWTEYEGRLWFSRSTDRGVSFSAPLRVAGGGDAPPARGPALGVDAENRVYLAWTVGEASDANIHVALSQDGGRSFGQPRIPGRSAGHADAPKIAVDGGGVVHLVYAERPAGLFERYHIRYTRSRDRGRSFEAPREITRPSGAESASFPALSVDGRGNPYVLWEMFPAPGGPPRGLGFAWSSDGGQTFVPSTTVPGSDDPALGANGGREGLLMRRLAVNQTADIAVVQSTFKGNERSHVWLYRGRGSRPP